MAEKQELDFGDPLATDKDYAALQQRKAMVRALMEGTQKAQGGSFRKNPLAVFADFMTMKNSRDKVQSITAEEQAIFAKHKGAEQAAVQELINVLASGQDPHATLLKLQASPYKGARSLAAQVYKDRGETFRNLNANWAGKGLDLDSSLRGAGTHNIGALQKAPPLPPASLESYVSPQGRNIHALKVPQMSGQDEYKVVADPMQVTTHNYAQQKPALEAEEQAGKHWMDGGKGYEAAQKVQAQLNNSQDLLRTLMENPQMGAGAEAFQWMAKWAEQIAPGSTKGMTALNEQTIQMLGQRVIDTLGGLGNQVSNADVEFMKQALGSLGSDPTALRRMVLLGMKYQMRGIAKMEQEKQRVENMNVFRERGVQFPQFTFNTELPPQMADELEQVFLGRIPKLGNPPPSARQPAAPGIGGTRIRPLGQ